MKTLKLDFETTDLRLKPEPPENKIPTGIELTRRTIGNMIYMYSAQKRPNPGLNKLERNQAYWLQDNLKGASEKGLPEIEIPDDVMGFVRKIFRETNADPSKILQAVEGNIDAVKVE